MASLTNLIPMITNVLTAPGVDLNQISAKSVRKSMLAADKSLDPEWVKANKKGIDELIAQVFNTVAQSTQIPSVADPPPSVAPNKRKHEDVESNDLALSTSQDHILSGPSTSDTGKKQKTEQELADEEYARQLAAEINAGSRTTRGSSSGTVVTRKSVSGKAKGGKGSKSKRNGADSDGEDDDGHSGDDPGTKKKRKKKEGGEGRQARGGFAKTFTLSEPLAELTGHRVLSRPQVVKAIWGHIKANDLQDPRDKRDIICDDKMRAVFRSDVINMFKMTKEIGSHLYEVS
ncbi:uncharacterized protein EI90DRAFT_3278665 [Cantharellus anzutake]|uniref:uncharacterized protein n=1 Tax=Cantharellus anzutake TaxID=1750568 RepID=UPI0019074677|nr:uncharacterized protein EI90DRAFT_3278665 [Cantharellus anzutake]KAF8342715.1 hypothetical protein EI90DRAFT_3278665 [Cantharellus anzutake]